MIIDCASLSPDHVAFLQGHLPLLVRQEGFAIEAFVLTQISLQRPRIGAYWNVIREWVMDRDGIDVTRSSGFVVFVDHGLDSRGRARGRTITVLPHQAAAYGIALAINGKGLWKPMPAKGDGSYGTVFILNRGASAYCCLVDYFGPHEAIAHLRAHGTLHRSRGSGAIIEGSVDALQTFFSEGLDAVVVQVPEPAPLGR